MHSKTLIYSFHYVAEKYTARINRKYIDFPEIDESSQEIVFLPENILLVKNLSVPSPGWQEKKGCRLQFWWNFVAVAKWGGSVVFQNIYFIMKMFVIKSFFLCFFYLLSGNSSF